MTTKPANPKLLWFGDYLDGKLSLELTENAYVIQYVMTARDIDLVGYVDVSGCDIEDTQDLVDTVMAAVGKAYLERVQFHMKAKVESGEAYYQ